MELAKASPATCGASSAPGCSGFEFPHEIQPSHSLNVSGLMPPHKDIPREFNSDRNEWTLWQRKWFFEGLDGTPEPKDGIDAKKAMRHLATIQRSWMPKHEHKEAAVAYLASLWFRSPNQKLTLDAPVERVVRLLVHRNTAAHKTGNAV